MILADDDHKALSSNGVGPLNEKSKKTVNKMFQFFEERCYSIAHLFYSDSLKYWYLFYFDNRDLSDIKNHNSELSLDQILLLDIRKLIAEIYFYIDKIRLQERRRTEWQQHGPPSSIHDKFKKYMKSSQTDPFEEADSES